MITFLLSLIPGPWLAVLKGLPWRLIGYGVAVVAVAVLGWRIHAWHDGYKALQATEKALKTSRAEASKCTDEAAAAALAYQAAAGKAKATEEADKRAAEEIQRDLQAKLAAADASSRKLSSLLRQYQARRCSGTLPDPAGPATVPDGTSGESSGETEVDRRTDAYHAACDRDATRLDGWREWWESVRGNR